MSLTFGYDLKKGDRIAEAPVQLFMVLRPYAVPGKALVNYFPFCTLSNAIPAMIVVLNSYFQCGGFLHGSHTSAMNHWHGWLES